MSYQSKFTGAEIDAGIDAANAALPKNGGTMIGALILAGDPAEEKAAVTKKYVDDAIENISKTPGDDGEDGVSPTISVTEIEDGHRITIMDVNGTQSFDVLNGKDGADGTGGDGSGDMLKSIYDANNDGIVDNAAKLGGKAPSEYYGKENPPPYPVTSVNGMTGDVVIAGGGGTGDMQKGIYDVDGNGIVDNAERLGGKLPEEYADADHEHDGITYNTTEQLTGDTWIDGKPIYMKTLVQKNAQGNTTYNLSLGSNVPVDTAWVDAQNTFLRHITNNYVYSIGCANDSRCLFMALYNMSNKAVEVFTKDAGNIEYYVTVKYTKTTD